MDEDCVNTSTVFSCRSGGISACGSVFSCRSAALGLAVLQYVMF